MIGNKIADKITSVSKKSVKELPNEDVDITTPKKRYISPEETQQIIDELRLIPKKMRFLKNIHTHTKKTTNY